MSAVVRASKLRKRYGKTDAVDGISFEIEAGRIVGLIGPNGAGKTTALKAMLGLTRFDGELEVLGLNPSKQRAKLMQDVCFIADVAVLPRWIRAGEAVDFVEAVHPRFNREKALEFISKTKVSMDQKVKAMSKGMVAQLHLALVMAIDAKLLVLDEPTLGLDILYRKAFYSNLLNDYFDEERTIIITTHNVEEIEHILTHVMFIQDGKIVLDADMEDVHSRYVEVMVKPEKAEEARALNPMHEREVFGRHIFLFQDKDRQHLKEMGEIHTPSVADLFVAVMTEGMQ